MLQKGRMSVKKGDRGHLRVLSHVQSSPTAFGSFPSAALQSRHEYVNVLSVPSAALTYCCGSAHFVQSEAPGSMIRPGGQTTLKSGATSGLTLASGPAEVRSSLAGSASEVDLGEVDLGGRR